MKKSTGKVIKAIRKHHNFTQEYVADLLNITPNTLANIENGRVGLDLEKLYLISLVFKIPAREILSIIIEIYEKKSDEGLISAVKQFNNSFDDHQNQ